MIERFRQMVEMSGPPLECAFCKKELEPGQPIVFDEDEEVVYCNTPDASCVIRTSFEEGKVIRGISCVLPDLRDLL